MKRSHAIIATLSIAFCACIILVGWLLSSHKRQVAQQRQAVQQAPSTLNVSTLWDAENHEKQRIQEKRRNWTGRVSLGKKGNDDFEVKSRLLRWS